MPLLDKNPLGRSLLLDLPKEIITEIMYFLPCDDEDKSLVFFAHTSYNLWELSQQTLLPYFLLKNIIHKKEALQPLFKELEKLKEEWSFSLKKDGCSFTCMSLCWGLGVAAAGFFDLGFIGFVDEWVANGMTTNLAIGGIMVGGVAVLLDFLVLLGIYSCIRSCCISRIEHYRLDTEVRSRVRRNEQLEASIQVLQQEQDEQLEQVCKAWINKVARNEPELALLINDPVEGQAPLTATQQDQKNFLLPFWMMRGQVITGQRKWFIEEPPLRVRVEEVDAGEGSGLLDEDRAQALRYGT